MKRGVLIIAGLAVVLVAAFTVYALVTRQPQVAGSNVLTVYLPFDEVKVYEKISAGFSAANPGAELIFKYIEAKDAKEYEAKVVNEIADGEGPDIWLVRSDWIAKHAAKSVAFAPTSNQSDPIASAKTLIEPALVDLNIHLGQLYGIPLFGDSLAVIYNRDLYESVADSASAANRKILEKIPATWATVQEQSAIATDNNGNVISRSAIALGTVETMYAPVDVFSAMLVQNGARILTEDGGDIAFNLARFQNNQPIFPATEATELFTSFAQPSKSNYSWNNDLGDAVTAFKSQKTGAIIGYYSLLQQLIKDKVGFTMVVAPLPQLLAEGNRIDFGVTWSHIISNQTDNQTLSLDYLAYLANSDVQAAYITETAKLSVSPVSDSIKVAAVELGEARNLYQLQLATVKQLGKPEWIEVDELLQDLIKLVVNSQRSPQASVDSIAEKMKELVD